MNEQIWTIQNPNLDMQNSPHSAQNAYWWQEVSYQQNIADALQQENDIEKANLEEITTTQLDETD